MRPRTSGGRSSLPTGGDGEQVDARPAGRAATPLDPGRVTVAAPGADPAPPASPARGAARACSASVRSRGPRASTSSSTPCAACRTSRGPAGGSGPPSATPPSSPPCVPPHPRPSGWSVLCRPAPWPASTPPPTSSSCPPAARASGSSPSRRSHTRLRCWRATWAGCRRRWDTHPTAGPRSARPARGRGVARGALRAWLTDPALRGPAPGCGRRDRRSRRRDVGADRRRARARPGACTTAEVTARDPRDASWRWARVPPRGRGARRSSCGGSAPGRSSTGCGRSTLGLLVVGPARVVTTTCCAAWRWRAVCPRPRRRAALAYGRRVLLPRPVPQLDPPRRRARRRAPRRPARASTRATSDAACARSLWDRTTGQVVQVALTVVALAAAAVTRRGVGARRRRARRRRGPRVGAAPGAARLPDRRVGAGRARRRARGRSCLGRRRGRLGARRERLRRSPFVVAARLRRRRRLARPSSSRSPCSCCSR